MESRPSWKGEKKAPLLNQASIHIGGGLETQSITEFFGEFGSGKTQIMLQLAVNATMPEEQGGLNSDVHYMPLQRVSF